MTKHLRRFYVYAFLRSKSSENGPKYSPYYIGKGCESRAFNGYGRTIPSPSDKSFVVFIQEGLTEQEAFDLEKFCINLYGRIDKKSGVLWNMTNGGDGVSGYLHTTETKVLLSSIKAGRQPWLGKTHKEISKAKMSQRRLKYLYELIDPSGDVYITDNLRSFAIENSLHHSSIHKVVTGKRKHHKFWTGKIIEEVR